MLIQLIWLAVRSGEDDAFTEALLQVRRRVFGAAGFRGFDVAQSAEFSSSYLTQIRWASTEEMLAYAESGRMDAAWSLVDPYLAKPLQAEHYLERPGLGLRGPGTEQDLLLD